SQRAFRVVPHFFKAANPVIALVIAPHVVAARENGVVFGRLAFERFAGGGPVTQIAGFEIEVERSAVFAEGFDALRRGGQWCDGDNERHNAEHDESRTKPGHEKLVAILPRVVKRDSSRVFVNSMVARAVATKDD